MNLAPLEKLIQLLDQHRPADEKEAADVQLIRQMSLANPAIFSRHTFPGHITGSALVLDIPGENALLHFHRSLQRWLQFGGHANDGEMDPASIAMREAREESGLSDLVFYPAEFLPRPLDIDIHPIPAAKGQPDHLHLDFRYLLATGQPEAISATAGESDQFRWLSLAEIETIENQVDPSLFRFLVKARRLFRQSSSS